MTIDKHGSESDTARSTRRTFLRDAAVAGGTLVGGPVLLAACGGSSGATTSAGSTSSAAVGTPKRGGVLRVGISAGGATDTLDAQHTPSTIDIARAAQLYDRLFQRDPAGNIAPMLALESSLNSAGDVLTVKLRPNVKFHDGTPFTSKDVVYSFNRILNPKTGADIAAQLSLVLAPSGVHAVDPTTVRFNFKTPYNNFEDIAGRTSSSIVPVGFDPKKPIGTGPFKYQSFTPGAAVGVHAQRGLLDRRRTPTRS